MEKLIVGNVKFTRPVVEKLVDIHYVVVREGRDILNHRYFILDYGEFDTPVDELVKKLGEEDIKLLVVDETVLVDFGDEDIQKHLDTKIFYDSQWLKKYSPPEEGFENWLVEFVDQLILANKGKC